MAPPSIVSVLLLAAAALLAQRCIAAALSRPRRQAGPQYNFYNLVPSRIGHVQPAIVRQQHRRPATYEIVLSDHNEAYEYSSGNNNSSIDSNANGVRQAYIYQDAHPTPPPPPPPTTTTTEAAPVQPIGYILVNRRGPYNGLAGRWRALPRPVAFFRAERLVS